MPAQVLDLSLPEFRAVVEGYQEHMFDLKCLTVYEGFWSGYYTNSKHPKPLGTVLKKLYQEHLKAKKTRSSSARIRPEVNVEQFQERERKFKARVLERK